jgi:hypothetical protein
VPLSVSPVLWLVGQYKVSVSASRPPRVLEYPFPGAEKQPALHPILATVQAVPLFFEVSHPSSAWARFRGVFDGGFLPAGAREVSDLIATVQSDVVDDAGTVFPDVRDAEDAAGGHGEGDGARPGPDGLQPRGYIQEDDLRRPVRGNGETSV